MNAWVLLLRGINVGGTGKLPMTELKAILATLGVRNIATYVQSGNAVFTGMIDARGFGAQVADEIQSAHGFRPRCLVLAADDFAAALAAFPFGDPAALGKTGHIWFLAEEATPDEAALDKLAVPSERYAFGPGAFYLHAPDGIGRSKLAAAAERHLGTPATARNLNTCAKIAEMLAALPKR